MRPRAAPGRLGAYLAREDPHHEQFQRAREALGLDVVAFDYAYDHAGRQVVWEANPYPLLHFPSGRRHYRAAAVERTLATILKLYMSRAGMPVPAQLDDLLHVAAG